MSLPKPPKVEPPAQTPPAPMAGADELKLGGASPAGTPAAKASIGRLKLRASK